MSCALLAGVQTCALPILLARLGAGGNRINRGGSHYGAVIKSSLRAAWGGGPCEAWWRGNSEVAPLPLHHASRGPPPPLPMGRDKIGPLYTPKPPQNERGRWSKAYSGPTLTRTADGTDDHGKSLYRYYQVT